MADSEIEQLKSSLLDEQQMELEYLEIWKEHQRDVRLLHHIAPKEFAEIEAYVRDPPLEVRYMIEVETGILRKLILKNNQRLLRLMTLIASKPT